MIKLCHPSKFKVRSQSSEVRVQVPKVKSVQMLFALFLIPICCFKFLYDNYVCIVLILSSQVKGD